jgi:hypothetical protein
MKQTSTLFLSFAALISYAAAASPALKRATVSTVPVSLSQTLSIDVAQVPACAVSGLHLFIQDDARVI